jgi:two-component system, NarL family, invasion response regulator UvrY
VTRVLIADDHPVVRKGLIHILKESGDIEVTAEASDAAGVLRVLGSGIAVDVVVLDVGMPGRSGLDLLLELKREYPSLPILILSQYPAEQIAVRAIRSGASGYLNKESAPEQLVAAVHRLRQGKRYLTDTTADLLAESVEAGSGLPHETLSAREFDVLRLIASGKTVSLIAAELNLSVKTISTYRARILEKMNLSTNAELTYYGIRNGLVE